MRRRNNEIFLRKCIWKAKSEFVYWTVDVRTFWTEEEYSSQIYSGLEFAAKIINTKKLSARGKIAITHYFIRILVIWLFQFVYNAKLKHIKSKAIFFTDFQKLEREARICRKMQVGRNFILSYVLSTFLFTHISYLFPPWKSFLLSLFLYFLHSWKLFPVSAPKHRPVARRHPGGELPLSCLWSVRNLLIPAYLLIP